MQSNYYHLNLKEVIVAVETLVNVSYKFHKDLQQVLNTECLNLSN